MAKVQVMHKAVMLSSDLTIEEIKKAEAIIPEALQIVDRHDNVIFAVATGNCEGMSTYGVVFNKENKISVLIDEQAALTADKVEEYFGSILLRLTRVEDQVKAHLADIKADLKDMISFVK